MIHGEVRGTITNKIAGSISTNTKNGIYGMILDTDYISGKQEIGIKSKADVKEGKAQIYCSVNYGKCEYYDIEIVKIMPSSDSNKNMLLKVTDKNLLSLTGGIIQGMSGSPIIQDGMIIGAVTHVLLNDPTTGYGVFVENMLKDMYNMENW